MKVRDPKRIIMPGETPNNVDMAVQEMRARQAFENNPMVKMLQESKHQMALLGAQVQVLMVRIQALTEYLAQAGILLHQDLDDTGKPIGTPHTPNVSETKLYEALEDEHLIQLPRYGYTTYFAEYSIRAKVVATLLSQHERGNLTYKQVIEHIRAFNNEPDRIAPLSGAEFGLMTYLNDNPDGLSSEELDALAAEFGFKKEEDSEQEGYEITAPEEMPVGEGDAGEASDNPSGS